MITVAVARTKTDCAEVQSVFNHKDIIAQLGGFCILENLVGRLKTTGTSLWKASIDAATVGGFVLAGRSQCHCFKLGEVGVLPEHRRKRVATCLYAAGVFQCILEGRRLGEDTIVNDNMPQQTALPAFGAKLVGTLDRKTGSFKSILLYYLHVSVDSVTHILSRVPPDASIEIVEDYYTRDLWAKNMELYAKHSDESNEFIGQRCIADLAKCAQLIRSDSRIRIVAGELAPQVRNKGANKQVSLI